MRQAWSVFFATGIAIATLAGAAAQTGGAKSPAPIPVPALADRRALLDRYCVTCHNMRLKTGDLDLASLDVANVGSGAETWEKVVRKVGSGLMPPAGMPRPEKAALDGLVAGLESSLDRAASVAPNPGRPAPHRLNRVEYTNAIRDLLDLQIDGEAMLPADDAGFGFDNIGDVLTMSPGLLERYLIAAQKISRLAVGDPTIPVAIEQYNLPYLTLRQEERMSEDLPFGSRGGTVVRHTFPADGNYIIKVRLQRNAPTLGGALRGLHVQTVIDVRVDGRRVKTFTVGRPAGDAVGNNNAAADMEREGDKALDVPIALKAGPHAIAVTFPKANWEVESVGPDRLPVNSYGTAAVKAFGDGDFGRVDVGVDHVQIAGPMNAARPVDTPARRRIFACTPAAASQEDRCARTIIARLARRAYRRPATEKDIAVLFDFYKQGRTHGGFDTGIQSALKRLLVDPDFLVRYENDPVKGGPVFRVTDLELASRLSFFLWSSIPDDELLDAASLGKLKNPATLEKQVRRMLADPRAAALHNFFGQWLWIRNVATIRPDRYQYPDFDENLRAAFIRETELFLESQLRQDRPVTELITANYTFVNERLAQHYGIPDIAGTHFRRVTLSGDRRAGLLGQGSVLTATSYANRTSPVVRGKWVLENLLGTPPPVPPPNVPPFPETEGTATLSVREKMEAHRKNPVCAACHAQLDVLGFAFENFSGIGKWREQDGSARVDPSGAFPNGMKFSGPAQFRAGLMQNRDAFIATVAAKLLTYALGRGVEYYDMPAVRAITRNTAAQEYRWSALIMGIVNSRPFQMRRRSEP